MWISVHFHIHVPLSLWGRQPLDKRLGGTQKCSGCCGEMRNHRLCSKLNKDFPTLDQPFHCELYYGWVFFRAYVELRMMDVSFRNVLWKAKINERPNCRSPKTEIEALISVHSIERLLLPSRAILCEHIVINVTCVSFIFEMHFTEIGLFCNVIRRDTLPVYSYIIS